MRYALANVGHCVPTGKYLGGHAPQPLRYEHPKRLIFTGSKSRSYFSPSVDQSSPNLVDMYGSDRSLQCRFPIDDILFKSGDIRVQVAKLSQISPKFWGFLGRQTVFGKDPQISDLLMWQCLVMIGQVSSEIRRRTKERKKSQRNTSCIIIMAVGQLLLTGGHNKE